MKDDTTREDETNAGTLRLFPRDKKKVRHHWVFRSQINKDDGT